MARGRHRRCWRANRARVRVYEHRRRASLLRAGGSFTEADLLRKWYRQRGECFYCGDPFGGRFEDAPWEADHVTPVSRGGTNDARNIVLTCRGCNASQNAKYPSEWRLWLRKMEGA